MDGIARQSVAVRDWALGVTNSSKEHRKIGESFHKLDYVHRGFSTLMDKNTKPLYCKEIRTSKARGTVGMALAA
jgi:hypothetical protein